MSRGRGRRKKPRSGDSGLKNTRYICVVHRECDEDGVLSHVSEVHTVSLHEVTDLAGKVAGWQITAMPMTNFKGQDTVELRCVSACLCVDSTHCRCENAVVWITQDNALHELDGSVLVAVCERRSQAGHIMKDLRRADRRAQKERERDSAPQARQRGLYIGVITTTTQQVYYRNPGNRLVIGQFVVRVQPDRTAAVFFNGHFSFTLPDAAGNKLGNLKLGIHWMGTILVGTDEEDLRSRHTACIRTHFPHIALTRLMESTS